MLDYLECEVMVILNVASDWEINASIRWLNNMKTITQMGRHARIDVSLADAMQDWSWLFKANEIYSLSPSEWPRWEVFERENMDLKSVGDITKIKLLIFPI